MTTFPKDPSEQVARVIKDHKKRLARIEARLDQAGSSDSKRAGDITTANTNIATQTTNLTALGTRLGGNTQETYLGTLTQVTAVTQTDSGSWTAGGAILGSSQIDTTVLTGWMNAVHADIAAIIAALHSSKLST